MPGLLRGVARTAVIAGTATAVSNNVSRRQAGRWAARDQQQYQEQAYEAPPAPPAPPPAAPAAPDMDTKLAQLKELGELKAQGILDDAEFEAQKDRILNG
jgi:Short C-terminal domain